MGYQLLQDKKTDYEAHFSYQNFLDALAALESIEKEEQGVEALKGGPKIRVVEVVGKAIDVQPQKGEVLYSLLEVRQILESVIRRYGRNKSNSSQLADLIISESSKQNYDPLFVAAVIKSESAFNQFAKSHVGATGLMQIMPATWKVIERFENFSPVKGASLTDPDYNLRLGIRYLRYLDEMFKNNKVVVLTAYNWGPGRVLDAFKGKRRIPPEVINYATKILNDYHTWVRKSVLNQKSL